MGSPTFQHGKLLQKRPDRENGYAYYLLFLIKKNHKHTKMYLLSYTYASSTMWSIWTKVYETAMAPEMERSIFQQAAVNYTLTPFAVVKTIRTNTHSSHNSFSHDGNKQTYKDRE